MCNKNHHLVEIGKRIKDARKAKGWSQETLAEHVNIHATYMSQIETGKVNLTVNILKSIADNLEISMKDLVSEYHDENELPEFLREVRAGYFKAKETERGSYIKAVRGIIYAFTSRRK
ncbi:helix-turn-helix transcriptional regulator [Seleniivibrio sp.]|uniref:helix-turn-helix domain-containing protein n=1 Tax=Seleniivibrio sp. TaxID=2898801 RepID=UPI0025CCE6AE|nr:helix-turn-helix transcriptional regulator [Seleniivibrio sp.]MCD8552749.1 helix-turn-helix domain-containing protein [Seleniivibrio sp.]